MEIKIEKAAPEDAEALLEYLKIVGGEMENLTFGPEGIPIPPWGGAGVSILPAAQHNVHDVCGKAWGRNRWECQL